MELLEPAWRVDLENLGAVGSGQEGVRNVAGEEGGLSCAQRDLLAVACPGSDLAFEDVQNLVFPVVDVQRG